VVVIQQTEKGGAEENMGGQFILALADGAQGRVPFFQQSIVSVTAKCQETNLDRNI